MALGRPRKPIEQHIIGGTAPSRIPDANTMPARVEGYPDPPEHLGELALECWGFVVPLLHGRGQLSVDSLLSVASLCECYEEWRTLKQDIKDNGYAQDVEMMNGAMMRRARPEVAMFADCDRRWRAWLVEFGLTDASRSKVVVTPPNGSNESDPLAGYGLSR